MTLIDISAVRAGWRFVLENPGPVATGAGLFALLSALQTTLWTSGGVEFPAGKPLGLIFAALAFVAMIMALAAWGRRVYGRAGAGNLDLKLGGDEGRLALVVLLVLILVFTVVGTAFIALTFMIAALALINVPDDAPQPEQGEELLAQLLGPSEWFVAAIIIAVFAFFSFWFVLRLVLAYPATVKTQSVQVLTAWPASANGRSLTIGTSVLATALPGALVVLVISFAQLAFLSGTSGLVTFLASSISGFALLALVGAPVAACLCALYESAPPPPE